MERIIVTSALPYANGEIHLGHVVSTYLPADIFTRYCRLKKRKVFHVCGTDDFGVPILIKAEKEGKKPEELVKFWWERDKRDFEELGISFDIFHKTSSPENIKLVQRFFKKIWKKGYIFEKEIEQFFDPIAEKFLPDRYVVGKCPFCKAEEQYGDGCEVCGRTYEPFNLIEPRSIITNSAPIKKSSLHYFFKLSLFSEKLKKWLEENKNLQEDVKKYVMRWIEDGLKDWDITRDIHWGVKIPLKGSEGKVLYGWFDNHIGYISFFLKLVKRNGKKFWNSAKIYHFIGKDIVYHHYLFMNAIRLAEGSFKLPDFIPTRGHLLLQGKKLSKSRGWYISLREFIDIFPPDYLRFYLTLITPYSQNDVNFDLNDFQLKINNELIDNFGNFVNRVLSFIWRNFEGKVPKPEKESSLPEDSLRRKKDFISKLEEMKEISKYMESLNFNLALRKILDFSSACNSYFQEEKPWENEKNKTCLFLCINSVRSLAILLFPFIPFSSEKIYYLINLKNIEKESWDSFLDFKIKPGHRIREPSILFKKVEDSEIKKLISKFK